MEKLLELYETMGISPAVYAYGEKRLAKLADRFAAIDQVAEYNQAKVVWAMQKNRVSAGCFTATTGYGYDDFGRDTLEKVYADVFHTEAALVRPQITCGTHALTVALSANLLPGDELLSPVGLPYDTLQEVIGIRKSPCSLAEYGVTYRQVDLKEDGTFDYEGIRKAINEKTKLITIQRSKGYATRPTFSVSQIGELIAFCKQVKPGVTVMVDNCYGEFVEPIEPSDVGADMTVGSLIKNPGGGLAPIGGYICGTQECVDRCAYRLSAPGLGKEVGANLASSWLPPSRLEPRRARFSPPIFMSPWASGACPMPWRAATTSSRPWSWAVRRAWWPSARAFRPPLPWIPSPPPTPATCPATMTRSLWQPAPSSRAAPLSCPPTVLSARPMRCTSRED